MKYFTLEELELLHMQVVDASGGSHGTRGRGRLQSVVATQTQEVFGRKLHETVFEIAGALTKGIIADYAFIDGNKRTGIMSAIVFIERNNVQTTIPDQELEDFAVQVATERLGVVEIAKWLEDRCSVVSDKR
ncbi:MAG: type II toxin-antitoxin system death-on-curing family toxin [Candidatus Saccharimonadales bacterium]